MPNDSLLDRLFRLRLTVARYGEMDRSEWWNTQGVLGSRGKVVLERGFPKTAPLARARVVFSVAQSRCASVFADAGKVTLWNLPAELEDQFTSHWSKWLSNSLQWDNFIEDIDSATEDGLTRGLLALGIVKEIHIEQASKAKDQKESHSAHVLNVEEIDADALSILAAGFALGDAGHLVVPFAATDK